MKNFYLHLITTSLFFCILGNAQSEFSSNTTLIGHWANGPCNTVDVVDNIACFGNGCYLEVIDVSELVNPVKLGRVLLPRLVEDVAVNGSYAYVVNRKDGLRIIDISIPANPVEIGYIAIPFADHIFPIVKVAGTFAYISTFQRFYIIDISNPVNPVKTSSNIVVGARTVAVRGSYVYLAGQYENEGSNSTSLRILDISNPASPVETGYIVTDGTEALDITINDNYAYVLDEFGFHIIDISDPYNPIEINNVSTITTVDGHASAIMLRGNFVYLVCQVYSYEDNYVNVIAELRIIDISNPENPIEIGFLDTDIDLCRFIVVSGDYAYMAARSSGLRIIDISNPSNPVETGYIATADGDFRDVMIRNNFAYLLGETGLHIIDISNPENPGETGFFSTLLHDWTDGHGPQAVAVNDSYAFIANCFVGLHIVDISNPASPTEISFIEGDPHNVKVLYDYVYTDEEGMSIIDISDPSQPIEIGDYEGDSFAVSGNYAFVEVENSKTNLGVDIFDIFDPSNPVKIGFYASDNNCEVLTVCDNYVYIATQSSKLHFIDISDPTNPTEAGFIDIKDEPKDVAASGNYVYVLDRDTGLHLFDISNPASPVETGFFTLPNAESVEVRGNLAFVADRDGLYIIRNDMVESIIVNPTVIAKDFALLQNYPNPFNPTTSIEYSVPKSSHVKLVIYDLLGRQVSILTDSKQQPGHYIALWDGLDDAGAQVSSGMYFCRMEAGDYVKVIKLALVR